MATHVIEGTWEEITKHAKRLGGRRVRLTIIDESPAPKPNEKALAVIQKVKVRQKNMRETSGESAVSIIRRGRAGGMYGDEYR
jgi:hypothetical protein